MKLGEFINELKHKTTKIQIILSDDTEIFCGDVSRYQYWLDKGKYCNKVIDNILCGFGIMGFVIFIKESGE